MYSKKHTFHYLHIILLIIGLCKNSFEQERYPDSYESQRVSRVLPRIEYEQDRVTRMRRLIDLSFLQELNRDLDTPFYLGENRQRSGGSSASGVDGEKVKLTREERKKLLADIERAEELLSKDPTIYLENAFATKVKNSESLDKVVEICEDVNRLREEKIEDNWLKRATYKCVEIVSWMDLFTKKDGDYEFVCPYGEFLVQMKVNYDDAVEDYSDLGYVQRLTKKERSKLLDYLGSNHPSYTLDGRKVVKSIGGVCAPPGGNPSILVDNLNGKLKSIYFDRDSDWTKKYKAEGQGFGTLSCHDPNASGTVVTGFVQQNDSLYITCGTFKEQPQNIGNFTAFKDYLDTFSIQTCPYPTAMCGFKTGYDVESDYIKDPPQIKCCPLPREAMNCIPDSGYETVVECDATRSEIEVNCNYERTVGTTGSSSKSRGKSRQFTFEGSFTFGVTAETSATVGLGSIISITAGLSANFGLRGGFSKTWSKDWSSVSGESWSESKTISVSTRAPPGKILTIKQLVGSCAFFDIQSTKMKIVTSDQHTRVRGKGFQNTTYFDVIRDPTPFMRQVHTRQEL